MNTLLAAFLLFSFSFQIQDTIRVPFIDLQSLEPFMDGMIQSKLNDNQTVGAVVSVVYDGEIILNKGYGYADLEKRIMPDPDSTLFRIGSISKLFTWLAVMQFVEEDVLDLDTDINDYIEAFQIPDTYPDPVTLRSILSHTPGFEDIVMKLFVRDSTDMRSLEEVLIEQLPKRVRPPLTHASYSNHATATASYIVEQLSGQPFEMFAKNRFFDPLNMESTTFQQPLPSHLEQRLSKSYALEDGDFSEKGFEYVPMAGAGGASSTASDMARFMITLLRDTCLDEHCLMEPETFQSMLDPVLYHAEGVNPALHGFMDLSMNDVRIYGHGGDTFWFHSLLALYPEYDLGLFISLNSAGGGGTYMDALEQFTDYYFPPKEPLLDTTELDDEYLQRFSGTYKGNRHPVSDFTKIISVMSTADVQVSDGKLRFSLPGFTSPATYWLPVDSTRFREVDSNQILAFEIDESGDVKHLYLGGLSIMAFDKLQGIWNPEIHMTVFVLTILMSLYMIIIWPYKYFVRWNYKIKEYSDVSVLPILAKLTAFAVAVCMFIFYLIFLIVLSTGQEVIYEVPPLLKVGLIFPFIAIFFLLGMIRENYRLWKSGFRSRFKLFMYTVSTLLFITAICQLYFWNLLGWNY
jgi:CubicO group peptidase (beta-lactamase class C family)